jgi:hypothetical protein
MYGKFYVIPAEDKSIQVFNLMCYKDLLSLRKCGQCYIIAVKNLIIKKMSRVNYHFSSWHLTLKNNNTTKRNNLTLTTG